MSVDPIHKSVLVDTAVEDAWVVFTARIEAWWPARTHSLGREEVETVVLEPRVGGRLYERRLGGEERDWGRVLAWDPPNRLLLSWAVTDGNGGATTEVEVRFSPEGEGTLVELEHRGWERMTANGDERRADYDGGWPSVLEAYRTARTLTG